MFTFLIFMDATLYITSEFAIKVNTGFFAQWMVLWGEKVWFGGLIPLYHGLMLVVYNYSILIQRVRNEETGTKTDNPAAEIKVAIHHMAFF